MKQPIHYAKIKHRTCQTKAGRRRSPVIGPSYDANLALLDETTGRTIYRPHNDNTQVIFTEIYSPEDCIYTDTSKPLQERMNRLWNDLYSLNRNNGERISVSGEIAIPNNISDSEMIELTKRLGYYFSTTYNRPIYLSIHKKPGNNHIHFGMSQRAYSKGKFNQKRYKIYKDLKGNLILDKQYKDTRGWDIRQPIIDMKKVPSGANPLERNPETGDYLYQKLDKQNRKQWDADTSKGKFLEREQLSQFHDEIDKVVNTFLWEKGYKTFVHRKNHEITNILKEINATQKRIPIRDYKTNSEVAKKIRAKNERNKLIEKALTENYYNKKRANYNLIKAKKEEEEIVKIEAELTQKMLVAQNKLDKAEQEYQKAIADYNQALATQNDSVTKNFVFTGTEQEKRIVFAKKYNDLQNYSDDENTKILDAISEERDKNKEIVIDAVLQKLSQSDLAKILKDASQKDLASGNYAKAYLARRKNILETFAIRYGEAEKYNNYDKWSGYAQVYYKKLKTHQQSKNVQKSPQLDNTSQQIDGR